jgi:hypothetical protein
MVKLCIMIGTTVGGYVGWAIGAPFGIFAAFALSMVGTGAGMYYGRKIGKHYEP